MDPLEIYKDLKHKIVWLELKPESTLNLAEVAASYGVSRNPVTIALTRLDAEEWVIRHGSHYMVSPLTLERMREITEVRAVTEVQANIWAMHRMSMEGLKELKELKEEIIQLGEKVTNRTMVEMDVRFHNLLYRETRNSKLAQILDQLLSHYLRFWLASPSRINRTDFFAQTLEIIRAVEEKDEVRLRAASAEHIKISLDEIMGLR
ncbi:MAG: GntR family transcriptional regulator [Deltaproteobacteria bacterium]|nr:GntR family transcriptional regulator [Deltaproteobacteria bacterium]